MADEHDMGAAFAGARALVTGGLGFIGSQLATQLVELGAEVAIINSLYEEGGANRANIAAIRDRVRVEIAEVGNARAAAPLVEGCRYIFNLAGRTSHVGSVADPVGDLDTNARGHLVLLELCRRYAPGARMVFAGTRQVYGRPDRLPVDESHPLRPPDPNAVAKLAGEAYQLLYHRIHGLATVSLRLTNTYGPGMRIKDARQNFMGLWLRRVLEGAPIEVWGGAQKRDLAYVGDVANAFLHAALAPDEALGCAFNVGGAPALSLLEIARLLVAANGGGRFEVKEFPAERRSIDIGDFEADDRLFRRLTGWAPMVAPADGFARTLAYYRSRLADYL